MEGAPTATPARQIMHQVEHVINFGAWLDLEEVTKNNFPAFLRSADAEEYQVHTMCWGA